jgi:hypothetical protein
MIFRLKNQDRINKAFKGEWVELDCWRFFKVGEIEKICA